MRSTRVWFCLSLPALLLTGAAKGGKPALPPPVVEIFPAEIQASADVAWNFEVHVSNAGGTGIYCDSVVARLEDKDPGVTGLSRVSELPLVACRAGIGNISAGDSVVTSQVVPARFESGTLRLKTYFHRGDGSKVAVESPTVTVTPGELSTTHPSKFLSAGGKKVETVVFPARPQGPAAGLLIVHDHGANARAMLAFGTQLSYRGYTTMFVSLPGYGLSEGPADYSGPQTVAALEAALDELKRTPNVDSLRVAVWGIGRGANAAMNLAARRSDMKLVIGQSGLYDLRAAMAAGSPAPDSRAAILAEAGKDSAAWRARSPLVAASSIRTQVVLLHGGADREAPLAQAEAFAAALTAAGDSVFTRFYPNAGHTLSRSDMQRGALPYLDTKLKR